MRAVQFEEDGGRAPLTHGQKFDPIPDEPTSQANARQKPSVNFSDEEFLVSSAPIPQADDLRLDVITLAKR